MGSLMIGSSSPDIASTATTRTWLLRANALYLLVGSLGGLWMDISGVFFTRGPEVAILNDAPGAGIGFIEAHGLALIIAILLWRAAPLRSWHLTAVAVHILLGTANLVFWQFFIVADSLMAGYVTTSLHWLFAALQLLAAVSVSPAVLRRT